MTATMATSTVWRRSFFRARSMDRRRLQPCSSRKRCVSVRRPFSDVAQTMPPLFLRVPSTEGVSHTRRILMPPAANMDSISTVSSPEHVLELVNQHYDLSSSESEQFVGGMGETDAGVWFCGGNNSEPLSQYQLLQESIELTKQSRHGVPFGLYTSGRDVPTDMPGLKELGLSRVVVSLMASNPTDYAKAAGLSDSEAAGAFGEVCNFCVQATEAGFPMEVAVLQPYASSTRDLAVALGAIQVEVYPDE